MNKLIIVIKKVLIVLFLVGAYTPHFLVGNPTTLLHGLKRLQPQHIWLKGKKINRLAIVYTPANR